MSFPQSFLLSFLQLNLVLVTFLRLGPSGLPYMVFDTQSNIIFPQTTNLSALESSGVISSYYNRSLGLQSPVVSQLALLTCTQWSIISTP